MTFSLLSPSSVLKVPDCSTESVKLMATNQAFLRTFYVRCSFRKPFVSLSGTTSLKDARTFSSTALNFLRIALNFHRLKERPFNFSRLSVFISLLFDRDSGHKTFLEDAFENEARMIPGGKWGPASSPWTNVVLWFVFSVVEFCQGRS